VHTPNLRRRTVRVGVIAVAALLVVFSAVVYTVQARALHGALDELLSTRMSLATDLVGELGAETASDRLSGLGVPATIISQDGERLSTMPGTLRSGPGLPAPGGLDEPVVHRRAELPDGTRVEVLATQAGVDRSLQRLLAILAAGVVVGVGTAYVLLHLLVRDTLAPLAEVAATAELISGGETSRRLQPDDPGTSLGRMATSFDRMLDTLAEAVVAEESERERTHRFLADAAHQLRTPLTGIRGAVELLLQGVDPDDRDWLMTIAVRETARASAVLSSLLHVARLDQGRPPARELVNICELVVREVERAQDLAPELDVSLQASVAEPVPTEVDPREFLEALANLLDNARRHAASAVRVTLETVDHEVVIGVTDDGPGVPSDAHELIFERFATVDGRGGSGLGLPIARGVARAHGGNLQHVDGTFVLRLPRSPAP
jgi:two-component system, OmpR family, sensor kinase